MSAQQTEPTGRPGRYQRSAVGLIVSLAVTVLGVGALFYFMGAFRNDLEIEPDAVDYLDTVASVQQAGLSPVYPRALPDGWIATGVDVPSGEDEGFMVRLLTDDERFVGVRVEDTSTTALLAAWVDEDTEVVNDYTVPADVPEPLVRDWQGYADDGGDLAYAAEVGEETVLVFGSASAADLQSVVDVLTTDPVG